MIVGGLIFTCIAIYYTPKLLSAYLEYRTKKFEHETAREVKKDAVKNTLIEFIKSEEFKKLVVNELKKIQAPQKINQIEEGLGLRQNEGSILATAPKPPENREVTEEANRSLPSRRKTNYSKAVDDFLSPLNNEEKKSGKSRSSTLPSASKIGPKQRISF